MVSSWSALGKELGKELFKNPRNAQKCLQKAVARRQRFPVRIQEGEKSIEEDRKSRTQILSPMPAKVIYDETLTWRQFFAVSDSECRFVLSPGPRTAMPHQVRLEVAV